MKNTIKKITKALLFAISGVLFSLNTYGQQDAQYSQYMFNTLSVNSAYAGTKDYLNIILLTRNQWVGFDGAPKTLSLTVHAPIKKEKLGLGFSYVRDKIGPLKVDNIYLDIAYRIRLHEGGYLSIGVKAGLDVRKNELTSLNPLDGQDPAYYQDVLSKVTPNFGAGLFYYTDKYYIGFSTPKLSETSLSINDNPNLSENNLARHYFIIAGYIWDINDKIKFKPSLFVKLVKGAPASFDLTCSFMFRERFVTGVGYRFGDSFGIMAQVKVYKRIWVGYAFDYTTSKLGRYNSGTHEIMVNLDFGLPKNDIIKSPRFF